MRRAAAAARGPALAARPARLVALAASLAAAFAAPAALAGGEPGADPPPAAATAPTSEAGAVAEDGAEPIAGPRLAYVLHCMGCHLEDGSGAPGRVPSLGGVGRFLRVPGGRDYLLRVPGVAQAPLDDAALAALLDWLVARFDPAAAASPDFVPFTAAEVARARAVPLADADALRRALLAALEASGDPAGASAAR